ncbi:hypothetical protein E8A73_012345 [Polyangium aurulentum]|nr:hypothetical protein E8A73_012345 [Polyangium aurulentum]
MRHEVVITGVGPILPNCDDRRTFWHHLRAGQSQLAFEQNPADPRVAAPMGRIRDFEPNRYLHGIPERLYERYTRAQLIYLASIMRAIDDAGIEPSELRTDRVGLFDGTSRDNFDFWHTALRERGPALKKRDLVVSIPGVSVGVAASLLGVRGPTFTYSCTCTSGAVAIGHALRELEAGEIDMACATGHDAALLPPIYEMYGDADLLSGERTDARQAVRPFVEHSKNAFGEGAVSLILERREHAEARGANILAVLSGFRTGNNGEHPTSIDPGGRRPAELISTLLRRHGLVPEEIGFVIGHGNGVEASDRSELSYMRLVFGEHAGEVPLLSTKPIYGHTFGASSALSVAAAALMLDRQFVAPTVNIHHERSTSGLFHQHGRGQSRRLGAGLVVAYGMGGQNSVLLLERAREAAESRAA